MFQFQTSTPEGVGIPSGVILNFLDRAKAQGLELHSLSLVRHDKVCAEGYWKPYHPGIRQLMYSSTKTVTAIAAGFAVQEGFIRMDETLEEIFEGEPIHESMRKVTIEHLLTMSCGHETEINPYQPEWIRVFLNHEAVHEPGTHFFYNTSGVNMIVAILRRRTGCNLIEFLRPRLFDPLGISEDVFCGYLPDGTEIGGGGLFWHTEDYKRFTRFLLKRGAWEGQQLLDAEWLDRAASPIIRADENSDYGYFIWMDHDRTEYSSRGMLGQFGICSPEKDAFFVVTSQASTVKDAPNHADQVRLLAEEILFPAMTDEILEETDDTFRLRERLKDLELPTLAVGYSPMAEKVNGTSYEPEKPMILGAFFEYFFGDGGQEFFHDLKQLRMDIDVSELTMTFCLPSEEKTLAVGMDGRFRLGDFFGETAAACGRWRSARSLELEIRFLERIMGSRFLLKFGEGNVIIEEESMDLNNFRAQANNSACWVFRRSE